MIFIPKLITLPTSASTARLYSDLYIFPVTIYYISKNDFFLQILLCILVTILDNANKCSLIARRNSERVDRGYGDKGGGGRG